MSQVKTKQLLIDSARLLFAKKGFEETTMNDIAAASGKGRRTLYTYFNSKEEIYQAVIDQELLRLSSDFLQVAHKVMPPEEKIVELIFAHLTLIKVAVGRNGNLRAEFFRNIWQVESVRKKYDNVEREIIARTLSQGQQAGVFEFDDLALTTDIIHACVRGLEVPFIIGRLGTSVEERRPLVERIIRRALGRRRLTL